MNKCAIGSALLGALCVTLALAALGEQLADVSETAETFQPTTESQPLALASSAISISEPTPYGTRFNLEPRANAQSQQSSDIDFLPNWIAPGVDLVVGVGSDQRGLVGALGGSVSGYYVSRDADRSPEYEGGLPPIVDPRDGAQVVGGGIPVVVTDPIRGAVFAADLRSGSTSAIGLFRVPAARLQDATACPNGTHTAEQAATCWPTKRLVYARSSEFEGDFFNRVNLPQVVIDTRISGTGAGNVYVAAIVHATTTGVGYELRVSACSNDLQRCSPSAAIAPGDDIYDMSIRPDGQITFVWIERLNFDLQQLKYRMCSPSGTSAAPVCGPVSLVEEITKTAGLGNAQVDHVWLESGVGTYVVWPQCKTAPSITDAFFCPDIDIVMKGTQDNGQTWSPVMCVACEAEDQFLPTVRTDQARNILNVAYYSSQEDTVYQRLLQVYAKQILPSRTFPGAVSGPEPITTLLNDPAGSPHYPNPPGRIGIAARGITWAESRLYVHFTYNNIQGRYFGVSTPEPNNHLARVNY